MKRAIQLLILLTSLRGFSQVSCNASGDVFVFTSYDGGHLTIDADMNIPGIKIGIRSYERSSVTIIGTYSANIDTIIIRGYNSGNNHCPPAITTNTVVQAAPATVKIYNNGSFSPYYHYNCNTITASSPIISFFTNGSASRLRGYTGWYECHCSPQKLSIAASYCCRGAYSCFTALPLDLISFEAAKDANSHYLKWETENEIDFSLFEVQLSDNAENFKTIGVVNSKNMNHSGASYEFKYKPEINKVLYYRLKMIDDDKSFRYSPVVFGEPVINNPYEIVGDFISGELIIISSENLNINLTDLYGRIVKSFEVIPGKNFIPINEIGPGVYFLKISNEESVRKLIIN